MNDSCYSCGLEKCQVMHCRVEDEGVNILRCNKYSLIRLNEFIENIYGNKLAMLENADTIVCILK